MKNLSVAIYDQKGKPVGEQALTPAVFGVAVKPVVVHEAAVAQQANARPSLAHTKTRGEVRGGGKKPWRQKGTGRARHGSIRSPIWVGGGVTFGPRSERNFSVKINRRTRNLALRMTLSDKVADGMFLVLDSLTLPEYKTKSLLAVIGALPVKTRKTLLVLPVRDEKLTRSARNIPGIRTVNAASLSVMDILNAGRIVTSKEGVARIEAVYSPEKKR